MPKKNSKERSKIEARRRQVAALTMRKLTQSEIAEQLGVERSTISLDQKALRKQWRQEAFQDTDAIKSRELAELIEMERDCALQFSSTRHPKWLDLRLRTKARIAAMMGLDAPAKQELSGRDGEPLEIVQIYVPDNGRDTDD